MVLAATFSLPSAIFGAALGSAVLVAAILLLARVPGSPSGMRLFGFAFGANLLRYVILLLLPQHADVTFLASEVAQGGCDMLLLAGSFALIGQRPPWPLLAGGCGAVVLYCLAAIAFLVDPFLRNLPLYTLSGAVLVGAGLLVLYQRRRTPGMGYGSVAAVLVLWGLHKFDYPWLVQTPWFLPVGFVVTDLLVSALAVTVIVVAARAQDRYAARARADLHASLSRAEANAEQLDAVLGRLADGVITIDEAGRIQAFNPAAERIFGRPAAEVLGQPARLLLPDPADPERPGGLLAALDEAVATPHECQAARADGTTLSLEVSVSRGLTGAQGCKVAVLRDVSGHRQAGAIDGLVQEINQRVLQGEGMDALLPFLCRRVTGLFGLRLAWISGKEPDGLLTVQGVAGAPALERHLRGKELRWNGEPEGPSGRAVRLGEVQRIDQAHWPEDMAPLAAAGIESGVAVPLKVGRTVLGALTVFAAGPIADAVVARLEDLAARVGIALQVISDQRRLRLQGAAIGAAANAIFITDDKGRIEWVNDAFTRLSGYELEEAMGNTPRLLRSGTQDEMLYHELWKTILSGQVWRGEMVERRRDGSLYTVEQTVTPMRDRQGQVSHFVVVHEDITNRKQAEERIRYLSSYDALTGLPNRSLFRERLNQALARAEVTHQPVAVLFFDLDHFSRVNDTMGHDLGDRLLSGIVERLTAVTRSADTLARVGGDEFAVILTEKAGGEAAAALARRLLVAVARPYDIDGHEIHLGGSVGISLYPDDGVDPDQMIKNADMAMYRAIHEAPNGYRFFSNAMNDEMRARVTLERDFRRAIGHDDFVLHYQPQLDVLTGRIIGLEALVRWNHPERGLVPPGAFIPMAEETGLIIPLGDQVLRLACKQVRAWLDAGVPLSPVAVNLSALQLHRARVVDDIHQAIEDSGIDPHWIELELTETAVMADAEAAERILRELDAFGIKLAIDDFGTGYSSLSYLKRFPVSKLKIDQGFVRSLADENSNDAAIARSIIMLGHSLGMRVVSEGVETEEQLAYLRRQGCDAVQGFLFSRPVPADEVPALLTRPRTNAAE